MNGMRFLYLDNFLTEKKKKPKRRTKRNLDD